MLGRQELKLLRARKQVLLALCEADRQMLKGGCRKITATCGGNPLRRFLLRPGIPDRTKWIPAAALLGFLAARYWRQTSVLVVKGIRAWRFFRPALELAVAFSRPRQ